MKRSAAAVFAVAFSATASFAQTYNPGDHVEAFSSMSQKWENAVIVRQDGTMSDGRARYFIHADDPNIASAYWGATPDQIRPSTLAGGAKAATNPAASGGSPAPSAPAIEFPTAPPPRQ